MAARKRTSLCHWGAFEATIEDGRLVKAEPWARNGADPLMIGAWPELVYSETRVRRPAVREGFLKQCERSDGAGRGNEPFVEVDWETALDLVAGQLRRVHEEHGPEAVFGGSYGWSSAGRLHHARSQLRRFLSASGGFTDQVGNYSWGAAQAILPHVLGSYEAVAGAATAWSTVAEQAELVVAFGGLNPKNWNVTSGGAGRHGMAADVRAAAERGVRFVVVSPVADDIPPGVDATWIAPRPNTDTAIMLACAWWLVGNGAADQSFLARYCVGHERFEAYLRGETDGIAKTPAWAAAIADVPVAAIETLAEAIATRRTMLTAAWSLQRADHGEQPFWALIALAAIKGEIGLPGRGFSFGYGSINAVGGGARRGFVPSLPGLANPAGLAIPCARVVDMLERPGAVIPFDGGEVTYPDVKLVWWAGGSPFHHAQDLGRLAQAWARPEVVIVQEPWWTPTARRADIVLPATTSAERNDLGGSSQDPFVFAMKQLIAPLGHARNDRDILADIAQRLGFEGVFTEGLDEGAWLRRLWAGTEAKGRAAGIEVPSFEVFWERGHWEVPAPEAPEVLLGAFRADPEAAPLKTPSGRIELHSTRIASFGYADCPPVPSWLEPAEWLGASDAGGRLHLVTRQPRRRLHGQLAQTSAGRAHRLGGLEPVLLNPEDAAARGLTDGAPVRVVNARGATAAVLVVSEDVRPGVAVMATGAWYDPDPADPRLDRSGNPNTLTRDAGTSSLGQATSALTALVDVVGDEG